MHTHARNHRCQSSWLFGCLSGGVILHIFHSLKRRTDTLYPQRCLHVRTETVVPAVLLVLSVICSLWGVFLICWGLYDGPTCAARMFAAHNLYAWYANEYECPAAAVVAAVAAELDASAGAWTKCIEPQVNLRLCPCLLPPLQLPSLDLRRMPHIHR